MTTDLFGNELSAPTAHDTEVAKLEPLKVRVLDFFKEKKFQSFILPEIAEHFKTSKASVVETAVKGHIKNRHIICTGAFRNGYPCLTLNLHRK